MARGTPAPTAPAAPWPPGPAPRRRPPAPAPAGPGPAPGPRSRRRSAAAPSPPPAAHASAVVSAVSATTIEARHASSSPAPIAANIPGSRDTSPAAVRTRSSAPREVNPSIGATVTAANSPTNPAPRSTATHDPSRALHLIPGGDPGQPTACTADAAFTTRCAASTTPASRPVRPVRPAADPGRGVLEDLAAPAAAPAPVIRSCVRFYRPSERTGKGCPQPESLPPGPVAPGRRQRSPADRISRPRETPPPTIGPMRSGISVEDMDPEVRPQDDLFGHVNGGWLDAHRDPGRPGAARRVPRCWRDDAEQHLRAIVEEAAASDAAPGTPDPQGRRPLRRLHGRGAGSSELGLDPIARRPRPRSLAVRRPERPAAPARQPAAPRGPGRGRALRRSPTTARLRPATSSTSSRAASACPTSRTTASDKFAEIRAGVRRPHRPDARARRHRRRRRRAPTRIMALETRLAAAHWDRVRSRDAVADLQPARPRRAAGARARPRLGRLARRRSAAPASVLDEVVVRQPRLLHRPRRRRSTPSRSADWKAWLTWHVLSAQRAVPRRRRSSTRTSPSTAAP